MNYGRCGPENRHLERRISIDEETQRDMRVLVVDDDPDVRRLCGMNLAWDGHEIIEASGALRDARTLDAEARKIEREARLRELTEHVVT
jgi:CheY-like chemotaxis protein